MTWQRTDGTLLAMDAASHRAELEEYFSGHSIPVVLEFHPSAPYLVGLRLYANDDGRVATAGAGARPITPRRTWAAKRSNSACTSASSK